MSSTKGIKFKTKSVTEMLLVLKELEKKKVLKKEGICYNIPGKVDFFVKCTLSEVVYVCIL